MRGPKVSMMRGWLPLMAALAMLATPAGAQQGRGGAVARGVQCQGCDSAQLAAARQRLVDTEIARLTTELARNRMLYENLRLRLAPDSPEPPRTERERAELEARFMAQSSELGRIMGELSARCGEQEPVRGYLGLAVETRMSDETSGGRTTAGFSYPVVKTVDSASPAGRAGIVVGDTIVSINRADVRGQSFDQYVRVPGERLTVTIARGGARRNLSVTVGERPPTFGGACLQYREVRFSDAAGQNVVVLRNPNAATGSVASAGTVRGSATGSGGSGQGRAAIRTRVNTTAAGEQQPVQIVLSPDSSRSDHAFISLPITGSGGPLFLSRGGTGAIVAGAEVSLVSGGLKTIFAVDHGALVLTVAPRSPAQQSGLVEGDVIVRASGEAVTSIAVLQQAIRAAREDRVVLEIVRDKQPKTVTLRW